MEDDGGVIADAVIEGVTHDVSFSRSERHSSCLTVGHVDSTGICGLTLTSGGCMYRPLASTPTDAK